MRALLERTRPTKTGGYEPSPVLPAFAGFLRGFVDLTFRAGGRYFVSDYKTNQVLGNERVREANRSWGHPPGWEEDLPPKLRRWHYSRSMLAWSMDHSAYHLQALVYTVAVHRMLKRRLPDYDYDTHFGGHLYLYVRGMEGDATPSVDGACLGVWTDRWPKATVEGLSAAFGGES